MPVSVCLSKNILHVCRYLRNPEEGSRSPRAGVTGICELLNVAVDEAEEDRDLGK